MIIYLMVYIVLGYKEQCCGSETIFFGSGFGSHFCPSFGSDPKYSVLHNTNNKKGIFKVPGIL
jgi:hypothetical protein